MEGIFAPAQLARRIQGFFLFLQRLPAVPMPGSRRLSAALSILVLCSTAPAYAAAPTAGNVAITPGSVEVGQILSGTYVYDDLDEDPEGVSTFRWLRNGGAIPLATGQQYTLTNADLGAQIIFEVTPVAATATGDALLTGTPVPSASVGPVVAANTAPSATGVGITGTTEAGLTLIGSYTYQDADGDFEGASTFRWLRNGAAIPLATSTSYQLTANDVGNNISFEVTPVALTGVLAGSPATSTPVGPVLPANTAPSATGVGIAGTTEAGFTLTGSYTYQDADGDFEGATTFRWLRSGAAIPLATTTSYQLTANDVGNNISFEVTPVALTGVLAGSPATSAPVGPVLAANTAPTASNVSITGVPSIGETIDGVYTYGDADGDFESGSTYRWLRNGVATGADTTSYVVVVGDVGTTLTFEVTPGAATGVSPGLPVASSGLAISDTAPSITGQVALSTSEETDITILLTHLTIVDPDSSVFTLTVGDGDNYSHVGPIVTPAVDYNGVLSIPVTINDGTTDSAVFNLQVTVDPVNDQPIIVGPLVPLSTPEDTPITVLVTDLVIADPDSAGFSLNLQPGLNYTLLGSEVTPAENYSGNLIVAATVTDDSGELNATSLPVNLTIEVTAENDFPEIIAPVGPQDAVEGTPFSLNVSANFTDADGDTLTFAIGPNDLPASGNISFDTATGIFSGTPSQVDARDNDPYIINISATDNQPGTIPAVDQFDLNISALDRANVSLTIGATPDPAMLNDELRWTFGVRNAPNLQSAVSVELNGSFVGSGLTVTSAAACAIQAPAGQVTNFSCTVGSLPPGGSTDVVLTTSTTQVGDVTAFAIAAGSLPVPIDPNIEDNSAQLAIGVAQSFSNGEVQVLGSTNVLSVAAGDVNGDGAADLVVGTAAGQPIQVYLSDGFRDFSPSAITIADRGANEGVALADFDNNGTLDLVVANGGGAADRVYRNDGSANFSAMDTLGASFSQDVGIGDFNNDGNMDIVFAAVGGNPIYRGAGNGNFNLQGTLGTANSHAVAVGRLDGDSNDDVVFANTGSESRVWVYNGSGNWFTSRALLAIGDAIAVTTGEFSGDGITDLAFARIPASIGDVPANPVLVNNGNGTFSPAATLLGAAPTNDIFAGNVNNVDGAGRDDLVFINSSGVHQIWVANGSGFVLHGQQIADRGSNVGVLAEIGMTDVGDPGGFDLAMGGALQSGVGIFLNDGFGNLGKGDAVAPVLTLRGEASVDVPARSAYSESGASALDNIDGDISSSVTVSGSVNTSAVGTYTVTYNVSDVAGNRATPITRTVNVTPDGGTGGGGSMSYWALIFMLAAYAVFYQRRSNLQVAYRQSRTRNKRKIK